MSAVRLSNQRSSQPEVVVVAGPLRVLLGDPVAGLIVGPVGERGAEHALAERGVGLAVEELRGALGQRRNLLVGQERRVGQLFRPLQRRRRVTGPDALQIGMAVRGARHGPVVAGRLRRGGNYNRHQPHANQQEREEPARHRTPLFRRIIAAPGLKNANRLEPVLAEQGIRTVPAIFPIVYRCRSRLQGLSPVAGGGTTSPDPFITASANVLKLGLRRMIAVASSIPAISADTRAV